MSLHVCGIFEMVFIRFKSLPDPSGKIFEISFPIDHQTRDYETLNVEGNWQRECAFAFTKSRRKPSADSESGF